MWEKFKATFKHSLTILWARLVSLIGVLLMVGQGLIDDPNVNSAIQTLLQPKYIPLWIIGIGVITELARHRTAGDPPKE